LFKADLQLCWHVLVDSLFTNHGLKDNQDESDFFNEAALFIARKKIPSPHQMGRGKGGGSFVKTESVSLELLRDGAGIGSQTFGSVVVQIYKQTIRAKKGCVVVEHFVAFRCGGQIPHCSGGGVYEETDSAGEDIEEEGFVDF